MVAKLKNNVTKQVFDGTEQKWYKKKPLNRGCKALEWNEIDWPIGGVKIIRSTTNSKQSTKCD